MNQEEQSDPSEVKKRILARKKVQEEMETLRKQIRGLRKEEEKGQNVDQDIEACLGYMKVLKKELDSIKEGSHATFLSAKKYISPKFNYGTKKKELLAKIKGFAREIRETEKNLSGGGYDATQRDSMHSSLEKIKAKHQDALLELKAIDQFNHTRFLEQKAMAEDSKQEVEDTPLKGRTTPSGLKPPQNMPANKPSQSEEPTDFNPPPMI